MRCYFLSVVPSLIALLAAITPSVAVTDTWDGGGADNGFLTNNNWLDNTAPVSDIANTDLIFAGTVRPFPQYASPFSAHSVTFNNTAGSFTLFLSPFTIGTGGIVNNSTNTQTFANPVIVPSGVTITCNAASGPLGISSLSLNSATSTAVLEGASAISVQDFTGLGAVTKNGSGTLTWNPAIPQQMDLTVNSGTVNTSASNPADVIGSTGSITVNGVAKLNLGDSLTMDGGALSFSSNATLTVASGKTLTLKNGAGMTIAGGNFDMNTAATLAIKDPGSLLTHNDAGGTGSLTLDQLTLSISNGGGISSYAPLNIGTQSSGTVTVSGVNSFIDASLDNGSHSDIGGGAGDTRVTFSSGATGAFDALTVGDDSNPGTTEMIVQSGATVTAGPTYIATAAGSHDGTLTVTGTGSSYTVTGSYINVIGSIGSNQATLNVNDGGTYNASGGMLILKTGAVNINGGTMNVTGSITYNGGYVNFIAGTVGFFGNLGLTIGTTGSLGASVNLTSSRTLIVGNATTIEPSRILTLNGGTFRTGTLVNNGTVDFIKGTLGITGAAGLAIGSGPLGGNVVLGSGAKLEVTNATTVASGALLRLNGGSFTGGSIVNNGTMDHRDGTLSLTGGFTNSAGARLFVGGLSSFGGGITNAGIITLQDGLGLLAGSGPLTNTGLITGDGTIANAATNSAGGQIRAENGKTLLFTGTAGSNAGTLALQGGTLNFAQPFTNGAAGQISGYGELYFPESPIPSAANPGAGFNNEGMVTFSGGSTLVFGTAQMSTGSHLIASGGSTVTFFDTFRHSGAEVKASAGSALVFFGEVRGSGSFTGTGAVYMEGGYSPGSSPASVTITPQAIFTDTNVLTMEIGGTAPGSQHDKLIFTHAAAPQVTWGGTLAVTLINGYTPAAGDVFDVFDFENTRDAGAFATITLPSLPGGLAWDTSTLYTDGTLTVVPPALTFTQWATSMLGDPFARPWLDHDYDGFDNAAEFALGLFPPAPGTVLPSGGFFTYADGESLRVLFTRPLDRTGVVLKVQASSDLTIWEDLAVSVDSAPFTGGGFVSENRTHPLSEPGIVEVRDILTSSSAPRRQIRLLISASP